MTIRLRPTGLLHRLLLRYSACYRQAYSQWLTAQYNARLGGTKLDKGDDW